MTPQKGRNGTRAGASDVEKSSSSDQWNRYGPVKRSSSNPAPRSKLDHPQPVWRTSRMSICNTSPGRASSTKTGPVSEWTRSRSMRARSAAVDRAVTCPSLASRQRKCTVSPERIVSAGGSSAFQR